MKIKNTLRNKTLTALIVSTIAATSTFASPPKAVSEMSDKELKIHNRDIKEYSFGTKIIKDKANGLTWLNSPNSVDPSTPAMGHYIRGAFKDDKLVALQLIVTHTHVGYEQYDRNTMDYKSFKLDGKALPTEAGDPLRDPKNDQITQVSSIMLTEALLRSHKDTGMDLKAVNSYGETDVPVKASLLNAYLQRLDKHKQKISK